MINDTSKPLVFLGSNSNILKIYELCCSAGYTVAGIIDDDYHGQGNFREFLIIASEQELIDNLNEIQTTYQFLCVTNWIPGEDNSRNREKRIRLINLLDQLNVQVATIISPLARVSAYSKIGQGVFVDDFAIIEPDVTVQDYVSMHPYSIVGHGSVLGRNSVIQRYCLITSNVTVESNVYLGLCSKICRSNVTLSNNTFLHPNLMLMRSTTENEEVSLAGKDLRKVYQQVEVE